MNPSQTCLPEERQVAIAHALEGGASTAGEEVAIASDTF